MDREHERSEPDPPDRSDPGEADRPFPQRLYDNIWLWAVVALVFWFLSYLVWGMVDLMLLEAG